MPARVTHVEIAVTARVVEVVTENAGGDIVAARVVDQTAESFALVGKRPAAGALVAVMNLAVMSAAMFLPDSLELLDDAVDAVGKQSGKNEIAEGVEEIELLFGQSCVTHCRSRLVLLV